MRVRSSNPMPRDVSIEIKTLRSRYIHAQKGQTTVVFSPLLCARCGRVCSRICVDIIYIYRKYFYYKYIYIYIVKKEKRKKEIWNRRRGEDTPAIDIILYYYCVGMFFRFDKFLVYKYCAFPPPPFHHHRCPSIICRIFVPLLLLLLLCSVVVVAAATSVFCGELFCTFSL